MDRRLFLLALGAFATSTVAFVFAGLLPLIAEDTGISVAQAGYLVSAFSLAYAIGTPVLSALTGALDRRRVIGIALLFFIAGNVAAGASTSMLPLFLAQVVMGAAAGLFAATAQATAVLLAGPERRAAAISAVVGGTTFAVALGAPAGSMFAQFVGWRGEFLALAVIGTLCLAALWLRLPHGLSTASSTLLERVMVVRRPGVLPAIAVTFLYLTGAFAIISYLGPLAIEGAGLSREVLPFVLLAYGAGAILGNYASGRIADRLGPTRVVTFSMLAAMTFALILAAVAGWAPDGVAGPLLIALMVPWGFVGWTFPPAQASRLVGAAPDVAHLTLALNASAIYFGIGFGTLIGGRALEVAGVGSLGIVGAVFTVAALLLLAARRRSSAEPLAAGT
ncbi:MFS transporter [Chelativorans sp. AA-79]|uniref:MFS transporter n=1 Tax=Chelativorans sp. AA-79 TaxID=3028735 RepID=UPI0023F691E5|nr:MFS transporter [Chelativorans sp. AA-79]WEX11220.1 MFS transporter [Chelativorans sp. AA-79]